MRRRCKAVVLEAPGIKRHPRPRVPKLIWKPDMCNRLQRRRWCNWLTRRPRSFWCGFQSCGGLSREFDFNTRRSRFDGSLSFSWCARDL